MGLRTIKALSTLHYDDDREVSIILFKKLTYLLFSDINFHGLYTYHHHISSYDALHFLHKSLIFHFLFISTEESALMRTFYGIDSSKRSKDSETGTTTIDDLSCISSSIVLSGTVKNSLLSNVKCNHIDVDGCVLINVTANSIVAKQGCIVYNIADGTPDGIIITEKVVLAGVFSEDGTHKRMESSTDIDGGTQFYFYFYFYIILYLCL